MIETALLIGLASWRLAHLFILEDGPWLVFERIRRLVGVKPGPIEGFLPQLFTCMWCFTVWTTIFSYLLWRIEPVAVMIVAAAAIAAALQAVVEGLDHGSV